MRRYTSRTSLSTLAELNITPLLDIAFTLLIIFMITTPLIENQIDLVVPTSETARTPVDVKNVKAVEISRQGDIRFEDDPVSPEELEARLEALFAAQPDLAVVIRPDRELPIQRFMNVMDVLKRVGIAKVGVLARPEDSTP